MTSWLENFLFIGLPYAAVAVLVIGILFRLSLRPPVAAVPPGRFLEPTGHFPAAGLLHFALGGVLAVHLLALFVPWPVRWWNASPTRLYLLEALCLALGVVVAAAALRILVRVLARPRLRHTRRPIDAVVAGLLCLQALTGVASGILAPWGTAWMAWAASPYLASLAVLDPAVAYPASAPWTLQLHFANGMLLIVLLPFTSLGHAVLFPVRWLVRPHLVYRRRGRMG